MNTRMIPKQAIEKAIEGGYQDFPFILMSPPYGHVYLDGDRVVAKKKVGDWDTTANAYLKDLNYYKIALDSNFWQALGKALGWKDWEGKYSPTVNVQYAWKYEAHRFYDLILTGKNTDVFWEELLRTLSEDQITLLYNDGKGIEYPEKHD